ncbi:AP-like endonuclease/reverse transcriptase [Penaeus vannamei]|uniref:AP-like endonuclease/reverse transcriptase n=1 Tax=Penaeus vannamei TaxID=6689 RepID=A0A3R7PFC4_PENVA|nr:AP-like endonuclease/reverse transcriptase [Penaeus vannamei]
MKEIKEDKKERKEPQVILQLPDDLSVGIMTALIHAHLQNIMEPGLGFRHHAKKVLKKNNLPDLDLDLGPQDEPETELFTTPQRKPTSTPTPTPAPTPTQSPVRPRTTKTNTPKQSPQQPRPQTTQSVKPKTTHIHRKHTDDLTDSEVDDQSLRHRDGYDLNPKTYGIRLFATEPSRYKHLNRLQLAHEITRGTIKWIYTDNSYQTRIHEQKITQHLHEGNMFIQPNMIEKVKQQNLEHIQNGWYNISKRHDPDIILINSHSLKHPQTLKIFNYTTYTSNKTNEGSDGVAIAVKQHIKHKILDTFTSELMAIEIDTPHGPIIIATTYIPPRRPYIDQPDIYQLLRHRKPTYIMGDFNAHHRLFGYTDTNAVGRGLASLISDGRLTHLGPHAPTFIRDNNSSTQPNTQANLNHHHSSNHPRHTHTLHKPHHGTYTSPRDPQTCKLGRVQTSTRTHTHS